MENAEKVEVIRSHFNRIGENSPCALRATGLIEWLDKSKAPDDDTLNLWKSEHDEYNNSKKYIELRRYEYNKNGLTFEYWNEINIEGDQEKIDKYIADREAIRLQYPKPS